MSKLLEFLESIKPDCTGYSSTLVSTIEARTGLTRKEIHQMAVEVEEDGTANHIDCKINAC
ncbi:MAG: hypothetical protein ACFFDT_23225 [Candidatus Hodarchaeota archaeon]